MDQLMELSSLSVATFKAKVYKPNEYGHGVLIISSPNDNSGDGLGVGNHLYHFGYMPFVFYLEHMNKPLYH
jgi:NAD(P)H-hydrate repair Nnr-like enzyme with NAD(P)H-hydrate epimerase domain